MLKTNLLLYSLIIAVLAASLSTIVTYYKPSKLSTSPNSYDQIRGFPFDLGRRLSPTGVVLKPILPKYYINPYILTFTFWFSGSLALVLWTLHPKKMRALISVGAVGLLLLLIDMKTSPYCLRGYPIGFQSICLDVNSPNNPQWFYVLLNYSYWLVISLVGTLILTNTKNSTSKFVKLCVPPLLLTLSSLVLQSSCSGLFICFFPSGRGFPFPFTDDGALVFFGLDYIFWWIIYNIFLALKRSKKFENKN